MTETVLFVCEDNSILSPMAEAFLRRHCQSTYKVYSAGIQPRAIHLLTLQVMEEIGYEIYNTQVKSIFDLNQLHKVDYLITLTDYVNENFVFNDSNIGNHLHWPFRNPLSEQGQVGPLFSPNPINQESEYRAFPLPEQIEFWDGTLLKIKQQIEFQVPGESMQPKNFADIRRRFRRTRDEMEVQVMNWLEEKGIGPLWWRGQI